MLLFSAGRLRPEGQHNIAKGPGFASIQVGNLAMREGSRSPKCVFNSSSNTTVATELTLGNHSFKMSTALLCEGFLPAHQSADNIFFSLWLRLLFFYGCYMFYVLLKCYVLMSKQIVPLV